MKIEVPKQLELNTIAGEFNSIEAGIDKSSMPFLFEMMSKSLYSNPIGSIIREITSNCFDSHIEAGIDDAVVISSTFENSEYYISFQDVGVGLSPERIKNIYMNYFSSTKRDNNNLIGGFGLGSKTPLSYSDYFYINTVFNGIEYNYIFSKGVTAPTLDLLEENQTERRNGTEIKIPIKNGDWEDFKDELEKQLSYFDNVVFQKWNIENDYHIFETELYKFRPSGIYSKEMHICLGKVAYPIDWYLIGLLPVKIPIAVKFEIGELSVTPNRENLRYTDESKVLIRTKVEQVLDNLKETFERENKPIEDLMEWLDEEKTRPHIKFFNEEQEYKLYLTGLKDIDKSIKFKPFVDLGVELDNTIKYFADYESFGKIREGVKKLVLSYESLSTVISKNLPFFLIKSKIIISEIRNAYINSSFVSKNILIFSINKRDYNTIAKRLGLYQSSMYYFSTSNTAFSLGKAKKIYAFIKIIKDYVESKSLGYYDDIEVPKEFTTKYLKDKKESTNAFKRKQNELVYYKRFNLYGNIEIKAKDLARKTNLIVYGSREDKTLLDKAGILLAQKKSFLTQTEKSLNVKKVEIITVAKNNYKYFKNKSNMCHVTDLFGDNRIFRQIATSFEIENFFASILKHQQSSTKDYIEEVSKINNYIGDILTELSEYRDIYYFGKSVNNSSFKRSDIKNDVLSIAREYNLYDISIKYKLDILNKWYNDIELFKHIDINEESLPFILKYLREKKKKLNLEYYSQILHKEELEKGQLIIDFNAVKDEQQEVEKVTFKIAN